MDTQHFVFVENDGKFSEDSNNIKTNNINIQRGGLVDFFCEQILKLNRNKEYKKGEVRRKLEANDVYFPKVINILKERKIIEDNKKIFLFNFVGYETIGDATVVDLSVLSSRYDFKKESNNEIIHPKVITHLVKKTSIEEKLEEVKNEDDNEIFEKIKTDTKQRFLIFLHSLDKKGYYKSIDVFRKQSIVNYAMFLIMMKELKDTKVIENHLNTHHFKFVGYELDKEEESTKNVQDLVNASRFRSVIDIKKVKDLNTFLVALDGREISRKSDNDEMGAVEFWNRFKHFEKDVMDLLNNEHNIYKLV